MTGAILEKQGLGFDNPARTVSPSFRLTTGFQGMITDIFWIVALPATQWYQDV